jgi:hypothetical protein
MTEPTHMRADAPSEVDARALNKVRDALSGLRFGAVTVVVQDGAIVQIERTEKLRIARK